MLHCASCALQVNEQPYTWQEHLLGWGVEIKQGAAGAAPLRAVVRRWDEAKDTFTLCFENGMVESGPLPHPLAVLVRDGQTIEWHAFFDRCATPNTRYTRAAQRAALMLSTLRVALE